MSRAAPKPRKSSGTASTRRPSSQPTQTATTAPPARKRARQTAAAAPAPNPNDPPGSTTQNDDDEASNNGDEDEDEAEAGDKRKSTFDEPKNHPLNKPGRHFGRIEEAFARIKPVLEFGVYVEDQESQVTDMNKEEIKWLAEYETLRELIPDLRAWIDECGVTLVAAQLTQARKNARGEDAKKVKDYLHAMKPWAPSLVGLAKDRRGMHHPEIAELIVPPYDLDILKGDDATAKAALVHDYTHNVRILDPEVWPAFLYHSFKIWDDHIWRGAFKSFLLVLVARLLFFGTRSLTPGAPTGGKCIATIWAMKEMTIGGLCYIVTLTFFALSADTEFQPLPTTGGFAYKAFYDALKTSLMKQPEARRAALLTWWNKKLFATTNATVITRPEGAKTAAELLEEQGVHPDDELLE